MTARLSKDVESSLKVIKESVEFELTLAQPNLERFIYQLNGMTMLLLHLDLADSRKLVENYIEKLIKLEEEVHHAN